MTFEIGVVDAIEKVAAQKKEKKRDLSGAGQVVGGTALGLGSKNLITGHKRLYHGTSKDSWKKIKEEGLKASKGGNPKGAGGSVEGMGSEYKKHFQGNSKGKVHVTRSRGIAHFFGDITGKKGGGKKIVKMDIPYDQFRKMEADPDMSNLSGRLGRNIASRSTEDISTDYIAGANKKTRLAKRLKSTIKGIPAYAKKYPGRFGTGVAMAAGGTALAAKGTKKLVDNNRKKK